MRSRNLVTVGWYVIVIGVFADIDHGSPHYWEQNLKEI